MCVASTTVGILGGLFSAYGQYQQGRAARDASRYNEQVARNNAQITEYQKQDAARVAEDKKQGVRKQLSILSAKGKTGYAAGNVALGSGSPLDYQADLSELAEGDIMDIEENRNREIWGLNVQQGNYTSQANLLQASGSNAYQTGMIGATSSLLSTAFDFGRR